MHLSSALSLAAVLCAFTPNADGEAAAFGPGEQSTFKIRYLGMTAGTTQVTVGSNTEQWGVKVWPIVATARSESVFALFPVRDRFVTYWDPQNQRSVGSDLMAEENRKRRRERIRLNHSQQSAEVIKQDEGGKEKQKTHEVPTGSMDMASAIFALRNQPMEMGKTFSIPVFTGAKCFNLIAKVVGVETLDTDLGPKDVFQVDVTTEFTGKVKAQRDMRAYFTQDPAHVLVRVEADLVLGKIQANLVEYKQGKSVASISPAPQNDG